MLASRVALRAVQQCRLRPFSSSAKPGDAPAKATEDKVDGFKPMYATKASFDRHRTDHRFQSAGAEDGYRPTAWQKRFLVLTKIYKKQSEIPEFVANNTMNRMHDRMRVVFIVFGVLFFFTFAFIAEKINAIRVSRDRESGVVVTKM